MKCKNCGANLKEGENFCGVCGTKIEVENVNQSVNTPNNNQIQNNQTVNNQYQQMNGQPINNNYNQNMNMGNNNANMNNQSSKEESTCTTFGIIGLIASFFINILSLPFSIIAVVKGSKLKKQTNKTQPGFIMGIIGIVLSVIIFAFGVFIVVIAVNEVNNTIDRAKEHGYDTNYNYDDDDLEDSMKVGNDDIGYIYVPEDWKRFKDVSVNDENMVQYSDASGDKVVTMTVFKNPSYTLEQYQQSLKTLLEKDNDNYISEYDDYIDNYNIKAKKIGGKYQEKNLYTWTFADSDGNIHYIALESTDYDTEVFDLIDTYIFTGSINKKTTY